MTRLENEIVINAPIEKIWDALTEVEKLEKYDPTVKKSKAITHEKSGMGAGRKVDMLDGKNWFEEKVIEFKPNEALTYQLTACSFPVNKLRHRYTFEKVGDQLKVKQVMEYQIKYGLLGKVLDALMIRKQSDTGIKKFFSGLKKFAENNATKNGL